MGSSTWPRRNDTSRHQCLPGAVRLLGLYSASLLATDLGSCFFFAAVFFAMPMPSPREGPSAMLNSEATHRKQGLMPSVRVMAAACLASFNSGGEEDLPFAKTPRVTKESVMIMTLVAHTLRVLESLLSTMTAVLHSRRFWCSSRPHFPASSVFHRSGVRHSFGNSVW